MEKTFKPGETVYFYHEEHKKIYKGKMIVQVKSTYHHNSDYGEVEYYYNNNNNSSKTIDTVYNRWISRSINGVFKISDMYCDNEIAILNTIKEDVKEKFKTDYSDECKRELRLDKFEKIIEKE